MMAAFSRSRSPMRPISLDSVICAPGTASARISPALRSILAVDRAEYRGDRDRADARFRAMSLAILRKLVRVDRRDLPPVELMSAMREIASDRRSLRAGRPANPPSAATPASRAARAAPRRFGARSRRCTTALVKCVVPSITTSIDFGSRPISRARRSAPRLRPCDIGGSGRLEAEDDTIILHDRRIGIGPSYIDADPDHAPPHPPAFRSSLASAANRGRDAEPGIDLGCYAICSIGVYGSSMRKPFGPNTSSASGVRMIAGTATETTTTRWP